MSPANSTEATAGPTPIPLSILIRTFNSAETLEATLTAATQLGGELVVVDAGSKDATVEIATRYGARVIHNPWPGFGPQRAFGERQCTHDHIFSLDSDEVVTPAMCAEIRARFIGRTPEPLMIIRKAMLLPHRKAPTPWPFCHEQILIFDRRVATTGPNPNWDKLDITTEAKPITIREPLWHFSYRNWDHMIAKANYVAQLAADTQPTRSRWSLVLRVIFEFPYTFLKFYFLRRYFLGGIDGFTMAVLTAFGRFARVAKMLERKDHGAGPKTG
jgi:glycosyltransferase involved in cell wall biosynthesis